MLIVDAQVHVWDVTPPERPDQLVRVHRPTPFTRNDLLKEMDAAGVDRAVLVTPMWEGYRNDGVLDAACEHPDRFAVMGLLNLELPESHGLMSNWRQQPGMLGVRLLLKHPPHRPILSEGRADWLWPEAEQAGVPLMILVDSEQVHLIDRVAERHPALKLTLDHMGISTGAKDEEAFKNLDKVLALAKRENIAVKATALPRFTRDTYPYARIHPFLRRIYDSFGPKRMFWGSDLSTLYNEPCTYSQVVTMFTEGIPWLSEEDKTWIMGRGICEWLGWPLPAE